MVNSTHEKSRLAWRRELLSNVSSVMCSRTTSIVGAAKAERLNGHDQGFTKWSSMHDRWRSGAVESPYGRTVVLLTATILVRHSLAVKRLM